MARIPEINSFVELVDLIAYDWSWDNSIKTNKADKLPLLKLSDTEYVINKTYITPTRVSYKTSNWKITNPMVFRKLEIFYELLQDKEAEDILFK